MIGFYHLIYQFTCLCFARSPVILPVLKLAMKKAHNCKQLYVIGWPNLWQVNHLLLCKLDGPTTSGNWSMSANLMHWKGRFLDFGDLRELLLWV
jgi:hypothetical protein